MYLFFEHKGHTETDLDLSLNGVTIPRKRQTKFLGVWVDDQLNWKHHMQVLITQKSSWMGLVRRGKNLLSSHAKKVLYFGQIHSLITYGMSVWGTQIPKSDLKRIQTVQNNCLRCIEPKMGLIEVHRKHKILKVEDLIKLEQYKLGYKACNNLLPQKLISCLFTDSKDRTLRKTHTYNTRRKEIPNVPVMSSTKYRTSYMYMCMKEYTLAVQGNFDSKTPCTKSVFKQYKDTLLSKY